MEIILKNYLKFKGTISVERVIIYTDGACSGNPGPGGWAALIQKGDEEREISGFEPATTNNRMELMAPIEGLGSLSSPSTVTLRTDSRYVKDGITLWIHQWKKNGWKTAGNKPVKNIDLWERLSQAIQTHQVTWEWVKGHGDDPLNQRVDLLARTAIIRSQLMENPKKACQ
jgi:ribonuclease HI